MNLLGIDYGRVYLGLAISREGIPVPLKVVKSKSDTHKLGEIVKICNEENIFKIIIGGGSDKLENHLRGFINKLTEKTGINIVIIDETLTSNQAVEKMIIEGISQKKRKEMEHAYAASLLLNLYLGQENG